MCRPKGDYGKSRAAVVVQTDTLAEVASVPAALLTSTLTDAPFYRLTVEPSAANSLKAPSQVMVDKILAYPRAKCGAMIGRLSAHDILALNNMLSAIIGLAD